MIYRSFKDLKLSQLGFGCMRFASDPSTGEIDQAKVNAMFDLAVSEGVNYSRRAGAARGVPDKA